MVVERIIADRWEGVFNHEETVESPTVADLEQLLDKLDADVHTMLTLRSVGEAHMAVGGGANQYVVYATFDNERFWNLMSQVPSNGTVVLKVGGQEGHYLGSQVVSKELALRAAQR